MTTATIAKPVTVTEAEIVDVQPGKPTKAQADAAAAELAHAVTTIRAAWNATTTAEADAVSLWEAAAIAKDNMRVNRCRVAYRAAMLIPHNGEANLTRAAIILMSEDYGNAKADNKAKAKKSSVSLYVAAGIALAAAGFADRITEPDAAERETVDAVFVAAAKAKAKAAKDAAKAAKDAKAGAGAGGGEDAGESTGGAAKADADALTVADLLGHVGRMRATLELMRDSDTVLSESDGANVVDALMELATAITAYSEDV